ERKFHLGAVVLNKVLPEYLLDKDAAGLARQLRKDAKPAAEGLGSRPEPELGDARLVERVLHEVGESFLNYRVVASQEADQRSARWQRAGVVAAAPFLESDVHDLSGLLRLGEPIWR